MSPKITLIAAMDLKRGIGRNGELPWGAPISSDMKRFRKETIGKSIVMGRTTFESCGYLPRRKNIILTRSMQSVPDGCVIARSVAEAIQQADSPELMIIGGESAYRQFLPLASKIILTIVHEVFAGCDTHFPVILQSPHFPFAPASDDFTHDDASHATMRDEKTGLLIEYQTFIRKESASG